MNSLQVPITRYSQCRQHWQPVVDYYWKRKRSEVLRLIERNFERLCGNEDTGDLIFVDLGCGNGKDLLVCKDFMKRGCPRWQFVGVDAQSPGNDSFLPSADIDVVVTDFANKLPFGDQEVDVLYSSEVIEHIPEPEVMLREIQRVLRPNGHLLLTTPNAPLIFQRSYWNRSHYQRVIQAGKDIDELNPTYVAVDGENVRLYGHVSVKTTREWNNTLRGVGFEQVDVGRGSAAYGCEGYFRNKWVTRAFFWIEGILDMVPRKLVHKFCSQLIGLYEMSNQRNS